MILGRSTGDFGCWWLRIRSECRWMIVAWRRRVRGGLGAETGWFGTGWGDGITGTHDPNSTPFPIFNIPPVWPEKSRIHAGFRWMLPSVIRWYSSAGNLEFSFIPYLYIGEILSWMFRAKNLICYYVVTPKGYGNKAPGSSRTLKIAKFGFSHVGGLYRAGFSGQVVIPCHSKTWVSYLSN